MPAAFNITQLIWNFLLQTFDGSCMTRKSSPHVHSTFLTPTFLLPYMNFSWSRKSMTHTTNTNIETFLLLDFPYHSTHIKFPKINSFLLIQLRTFSSQFHWHSYIHQYNCLNLLFLVYQNNCKIFHLSSCLICNSVFCSFLATIR